MIGFYVRNNTFLPNISMRGTLNQRLDKTWLHYLDSSIGLSLENILTRKLQSADEKIYLQ